jgi:hypothetical protein
MIYCIHRRGKLSKMAALHSSHYRFLSSRPLPVLELAAITGSRSRRHYRFLSSRPLPVLELAADALSDAAKTESEKEDDKDENHAAGEEVVPVRRVHHVLIQGQRTVNRSNLQKI